MPGFSLSACLPATVKGFLGKESQRGRIWILKAILVSLMKFRDFGFFMEAVLEQIYLFSFFLNDSNYRIHAINTDAYGLQPQGFLSASHMRSYMLMHSGSGLPVD